MLMMLNDGATIKTETLSEYSTASEASLYSDNGGPWRMFVPDFSSLLDEMEEEDLMLIDCALCPSTGLLTEHPTITADNLYNNNELAIVQWTPPEQTYTFQPTTVGPTFMVNEDEGSGLLNMIVEQALTKVNTNDNNDTKTTSVNGGGHATDTRRCKVTKRHQNLTINTQTEGEHKEKLGARKDCLVLSELEKTVERVESAVRDLPSTTKNKKIKKSISMAAVEVHDFTKLLDENTKIESMALNEDKAVVVLSSDSSEGSKGGGRKRKARGASEWERATAVSSRLRGASTNKQGRAAHIVKKSQLRKLERVPVKKVKKSGIMISTKLTLAPPMPGSDVK